ncbi:MAG: alpha-L-fucosidase [Akkermansiaceae bacterium]|jgi:alpha-L-fucosidase|nr:alpha-L-fucosidase [Akkermansiaceae bacterium]
MNRRYFLNRTAAAAGGLTLGRHFTAWAADTGAPPSIPAWLANDPDAYAKDPRAAATAWMREAKFGLFLHYGLYSLEGRHEWLQLREKIPVATYAKLKDRFTADKFDADAIAALAVDAGMKYLNITTRHHDSFCLFKTAQTDFNSTNSPAKRDLVMELAEACRKHRLGLSLYYSHGRDWRHPHAPNNDQYGGSARPAYHPPEPTYAYGKDHDLNKYLDFMKAQITELLTQYGPVMAIWLDGIATPLQRKKNGKVVNSPPNRPGNAPEFRCQELYDHIHALQPQVLVSYKQGLLGTEDFFAPEHKSIANPGNKPMEICSTLQQGSWGYKKGARRLTPDEAWQKLVEAGKAKANLLLNTGPLPDGSIDATDAATLRALGGRLRKDGFPGV